jgi:hypothetical protein
MTMSIFAKRPLCLLTPIAIAGALGLSSSALADEEMNLPSAQSDQMIIEPGSAAHNESAAWAQGQNTDQDDQDQAALDDAAASDQTVLVMLVPETLDAVEHENVSDDGTAQQFNRGYYKEPETIVVIALVGDEDEEE